MGTIRRSNTDIEIDFSFLDAADAFSAIFRGKTASKYWHAIPAAENMNMDQSPDIACTKQLLQLTIGVPGKSLI